MQIASMVNDDAYIDEGARSIRVTSSSAKDMTPVSEHVLGKHQHNRDRTHRARHGSFQSFFILAIVDIPEHSDEIKNYKRAKSCGFEKVLCQIKVNSNGSFEMRPSFNSTEEEAQRHEAGLDTTISSTAGASANAVRNAPSADIPPPWYYFQAPSGQLYAFRIENDADDGNEEFFMAREEDIKRDLRARQLDLQQNRVGTEFEAPPQHDRFFAHVFGSIVRTTGFAADNIYISYSLGLPEHWTISPHASYVRDSAVTHTAQAMIEHNTEHADARAVRSHHFCMPFHFELEGKDGYVTRWPYMYFQVASVDNWQRHRIVGYGHVVLPDKPGVHEITVPTWRPIGTVRDEMQRFFVGGSRSLRNIQDVAIPAASQEAVSNRYGVVSEPGGDVVLTFNTLIVNSKATTANAAARRRYAAGINDNADDDLSLLSPAVRDALRKARAAAKRAELATTRRRQRRGRKKLLRTLRQRSVSSHMNLSETM
jgi:Ciliary basal body-associated, B9 protein